MIRIIPLLFVLVLSLTACQDSKEQKGTTSEKKTERPVNIILLIGDGMGLSQTSITYYYGEESVFNRFSHIGLLGTSSKTHKITDSAASGTAFSTGEKTYNGAVGVDVDSSAIKNISEHLAESHHIGLIATSSITHATPAAFYAHVKDRDDEFAIAEQLLSSTVDFLAAGGYGFFNQRPDGKDLLKEMEDQGFEVDTTSLDAFADFDAEKKYAYLLNKSAMPVVSERGDFLANAVSKSLQYFDATAEPFFLMVEGSQIDWAGHDNDTEYMIGEVLDFQKAVEMAFDYAEKNENTLIIVTADHETGGFALSTDYDNNKDYNKISPAFATGGHSASLVPVFAFGPGAEQFMGVYQNSDVFHKIMKLIG